MKQLHYLFILEMKELKNRDIHKTNILHKYFIIIYIESGLKKYIQKQYNSCFISVG